MNNIYNFEDYQIVDYKLTNKDLLNLFLIIEHKNDQVFVIQKDMLMKSFGKNSVIGRYMPIFNSIEIKELDGNLLVDLEHEYKEAEQDKLIILNPSNLDEFMIAPKEDYFNQLEMNYNEELIKLFKDLMFFINNDLIYGLNGWNLAFEDEYIEVPNYPGIVTGEFIGKKRTKKVMSAIKEKTRKRCKQEYE